MRWIKLQSPCNPHGIWFQWYAREILCTMRKYPMICHAANIFGVESVIACKWNICFSFQIHTHACSLARSRTCTPHFVVVEQTESFGKCQRLSVFVCREILFSTCTLASSHTQHTFCLVFRSASLSVILLPLILPHLSAPLPFPLHIAYRECMQIPFR